MRDDKKLINKSLLRIGLNKIRKGTHRGSFLSDRNMLQPKSNPVTHDDGSEVCGMNPLTPPTDPSIQHKDITGDKSLQYTVMPSKTVFDGRFRGTEVMGEDVSKDEAFRLNGEHGVKNCR